MFASDLIGGRNGHKVPGDDPAEVKPLACPDIRVTIVDAPPISGEGWVVQ